MLAIVGKESPLLRKKALEVPPRDITSKKIKTVIVSMSTALLAEEDGVAIAAPQMGVPLRIFVVSHKALKTPGQKIPKDLVCINPEITKLSKEKKPVEEGCLSVRWLYGKVNRSTKATIRAYDENGRRFTRGASGLLAQIFQHETDHLNGILFTDKATDLHEIPPPQTRNTNTEVRSKNGAEQRA